MWTPEEFQACVDGSERSVAKSSHTEVVAVDSLGAAPARFRYHDGSKYPGGFGATQVLVTDYWTLRARSAQVFKTSLFGRGIVRRLTTNVIVTGLHLEATPDERLLGLEEDSLAEWSEDVERRFTVWASDAFLCDASEQLTLGQLQALAHSEALVDGDVLITLVVSALTRIPQLRLISGSAVQSPWDAKPRDGNRIEHGVELDSKGRHVAYWVRQRDGSFQRLPAWGEKSGRRLAWLVYGNDRRVNEVRGEPLLGLVLQSLNELDRYRDATLRKAVINSYLALWVEKTEDKPASLSLGMAGVGAKRVDAAANPVATTTEPRDYEVTELMPGMLLQEMQTGERIHAHGSQGTDEKYGDFEAAIVHGIAWALEIPPEILQLQFSSNYSASKAANNEFEVYLAKARTLFGTQFCQPIYIEWLLSETLAGHIQASGLLDSWRDPSQYVTFGAWTASDWSGAVKPSVDPTKQMAGYGLMLEQGIITRDRVARQTSGMKFSRVVQQLRRENEALVRANEPLLALTAKAPMDPSIHYVDEEDADEKPAQEKALSLL